jgi:hypothetical protein
MYDEDYLVARDRYHRAIYAVERAGSGEVAAEEYDVVRGGEETK